MRPITLAQINTTQPDDCWRWPGQPNTEGYGRARDAHGVQRRAHRVAYESLVGPIPEGLTLDHLCKNRMCVNPAHLEPVTMAENVRRGRSHNGHKTACKNGHLFTPDNTYLHPAGMRVCRACMKVSRRSYRKTHR